MIDLPAEIADESALDELLSRPTDAEVGRNPRARSARLRAAESIVGRAA